MEQVIFSNNKWDGGNIQKSRKTEIIEGKQGKCTRGKDYKTGKNEREILYHNISSSYPVYVDMLLDV